MKRVTTESTIGNQREVEGVHTNTPTNAVKLCIDAKYVDPTTMEKMEGQGTLTVKITVLTLNDNNLPPQKEILGF